MLAPSVPLLEKVKIYGISLLLTLVVYTIIDLYVPAKRLFSGDHMSFSEVITYIQLNRKLPFIIIIGVLMAGRTIKKRTLARATASAQNHGALPQ